MSSLRKALEAITYASDDGSEYEHNEGCEGEAECAACWAETIRQALAAHPEPNPTVARFVASEAFVVPLEDPNDIERPITERDPWLGHRDLCSTQWSDICDCDPDNPVNLVDKQEADES